MTKTAALNTALTFVPAEQTEVREVLTKMVEQLSKPRQTSNETKAKANAKRKEQTAAARAALMEQVLPVLREALTDEGQTAKDIFAACESALPADFTANKVQYVLLHEMANEVTKVEAKGKANIYARKA